MGDLHHLQHLLNLSSDLFLGPCKLQGTEGHFIKHRRRKELNVRILEDQPHAAAKIVDEVRILQAFFSERPPAERDSTLFRKGQSIENAQ